MATSKTSIYDRLLDVRIVDLTKKSLYTLWLFTESDVLTFVVPNTVFGIFGGLSGLLTDTTTVHPDTNRIISHLPKVVAFNWLNLLVFDIANQRLPAAIDEDSLNKPWRPLPMKRISPDAAHILLLSTIPVVLLATYGLGAGPESALLITLTWMYNDLGGGDKDYWVRNGIIASAFAVYNAGSLKLAVGEGSTVSSNGLQWIAMISGVIFTTMHVQDLKDQAGDQQRGRRTLPLVLGDAVARWTIVGPLVIWAVLGPFYWRMGTGGFLLTGGLAALVAIRLLRWRDAKADSKSWKLWALWTATLYFLPLLESLS
ncbi:MAG: hypothetical protein L6R40_003069 [Gallowayella cf. fulva]|nr:MAG: hypothetical protein L6R40_003069 [Xanthomendoza cf. fulva]